MLNQSKPNIYYSPKSVKKKLNHAIDHALDLIQFYCKDPVSNFTRDRKLPARTLIECIMHFSNHSTISEMSQFFSHVDNMPSPSALCQRRKLLKHEIFLRINHAFLCSFDNYSTINGYRILAQDGSDINIPFKDDDTKVSSGKNSAPYSQYHINALYDCLNHIFLDWSIDTASKKQEVEALINIIKMERYPPKSIFTADRGYESYNLFAHLINRNLKFAIRIKDIHKNNAIMKNIPTPEGTFDITTTRTLTRRQTREVKANKEKYVFVPSSSKFDFLGPDWDYYDLTFRIVRFKITEDTYETLITNLGEDEFSLDDLKELYHLRWQEETGFNKVKNTMGMVYFHAKKRKSIKQEISATFLMYNVCEIVTNNIKIKKQCRHDYKTNFASTVTNVKLFLRNQLREKALISRIKTILIPIRPNRAYKRRVRPKSLKPLNVRTS